jgi:hypothetical protein
MLQVGLNKNWDPISKITRGQKGWWSGSSSSVPA